MNIVQKAEGGCELSIDGELTIYRATELHELITQKHQEYQSVSLDMENVSEIDTACFQVLLHHKLKGLEQEKKLSLINCNESVIDFFRLFGVGGIFVSS